MRGWRVVEGEVDGESVRRSSSCEFEFEGVWGSSSCEFELENGEREKEVRVERSSASVGRKG